MVMPQLGPHTMKPQIETPIKASASSIAGLAIVHHPPRDPEMLRSTFPGIKFAIRVGRVCNAEVSRTEQ